ncbi:hypothetical protein D3C73_1173330 [compost metagenome]
MCRAEFFGALELLCVDVDGDDGGGAGERGTGDGCYAHAATADDGNRVSSFDPAGVERGSQTCHDAAAEQSDGGGIGVGVYLGALPRGHQGLFDERADSKGR